MLNSKSKWAVRDRAPITPQNISNISTGCDVEMGLVIHSFELTKAVIAKYYNIRLRSYLSLATTDRNRLNRLVIFKH